MASSDSFLRQLSSKGGRKPTSKRWTYKGGFKNMCCDGSNGAAAFVMKKRVMVIVDQSAHSKHAMMWALTHVTNKGDLLTLLHIIPCKKTTGSACSSSSHYLATTLGSLCKASKPEVDVEALVIQGPKKATVVGQVKKLEVSVLVLGQEKPSLFLSCLCLKSSTEEFVDECINTMDCLTIGVRKQRNGVSGYLISTRWHKNFWLLA